MLVTVTFEGKFNPKQLEDVKRQVSGTSVGSQATVTPTSDGLSIAIDSKVRQYLRPVMPNVVRILNARKMTQTDPSGRQKDVGASQLLG